MELRIARDTINIELLDSELRSAMGEAYVGLSFAPNNVTAYLRDDISEALVTEARQIIQQHDAAELTYQQRATAELYAKLALLRTQNSIPLDEGEFAEEAPLIRLLAQKVGWLELEIAALRGTVGE